MDNLRRLPAWLVEEGRERDQWFRVYDGNGFWICSVVHQEDLHARDYQYADAHLTRHEARRIAKAISRLPELMKRPVLSRCNRWVIMARGGGEKWIGHF